MLALVSAGTGWANEEADLSRGAERIIGGHAFMPSQYVTDPFVGSAFTNHVGAAQALSVTKEFHNLAGDPLFTLEGNVVFAALGMRYQQHLGKYWAIGLGGSALVRSGTNALSFINDGANVTTDNYAWVKRRVHRGEKSQLTVGLNWKYSSFTLFTPREFAEHIVDGGGLADAPLVSTGKVWSLQADVLWAYAFNPTFGLRANGNFGVVEDYFESGVLHGKNRISVIGEVDFKSSYDIPIGLSLGTFVGFPSSMTGSGLNGYLFGLWYTGREEFSIGLETGLLEIPTDNSGTTIDGLFGVLNIKYFF